MKNILKYAFVLLAFAGIASCVEQEPVWVAPEKTMSIEEADLVFEPVGGSSSFTVKAENSFTAASDREWCSVSVSGTQVNVTVMTNPTNETRYSRITLTSGNETLGITVHQYGIVMKGFDVEDTPVSSRSHELKYPYSTNGVLTVTSDVPWIKVTQTDELVTLAVEANTGTARTGTVSYNNGNVNGSFSIIQAASFKPSTSWSAAYAGREYWHADPYDYFNVTADASASSEYYLVTAFTVTAVNDSYVPMDDFVEDKAFPKAQADLKAEMDAAGGTRPVTDFLYRGSEVASISAVDYPAGSYYIFMIGVDEKGNPTGKYSATQLSTAGPAYNWWIGTWKATDNDGTVSTLTISAAEQGKTYKITGLGGLDFALTANYNSDGTFSLNGSSTKSLISSPYTYSTYVFNALYIYGLYNNPVSAQNLYRTGDYYIALGSRVSGNNAILTGYWMYTANTYYRFIQAVFRGPASNNGAAATNTVLKRNYLPFTLVKQ